MWMGAAYPGEGRWRPPETRAPGQPAKILSLHCRTPLPPLVGKGVGPCNMCLLRVVWPRHQGIACLIAVAGAAYPRADERSGSALLCPGHPGIEPARQ
ncbi:hypothetical protein NDU88_005185 [Pleurodeles waltl]|uniref:Uncharacterized protein n=1 Tax=Pleurodeles waltl TaxID=8319 RepID=A0AAV7PG67_PLEWA|nr:hypothetical protein NDU88_005185 [Pleurodeles waltl]